MASEEDPEFQIAPMIDILLVLLVFFMSISSTEVLQVNNQAFGALGDSKLQPLRDWLKNAIEQFGDGPVVIRPNPNTRHERIIDVLNAAAAAGVKRLSFS